MSELNLLATGRFFFVAPLNRWVKFRTILAAYASDLLEHWKLLNMGGPSANLNCPYCYADMKFLDLEFPSPLELQNTSKFPSRDQNEEKKIFDEFEHEQGRKKTQKMRAVSMQHGISSFDKVRVAIPNASLIVCC